MGFVVSAMGLVMHVFGYTYLIYFRPLAFYKVINIVFLLLLYILYIIIN